MFRLLAIDIDGTLVNSANELTPNVCAALRRAQDAGIQVVLATGRRYSRTLPLVEPLGLDLPVITASGALIKCPLSHRTLFQATFEQAAFKEMLTHLDRNGHHAVMYADSFAEGFDFYCCTLNVDTPELLDFYQTNRHCARVQANLLTAPPPGIFAGFAFGRQLEMLALRAELQQRWPEHLEVHVLRSPRYLGYMCEIAPAGITKWSGIQHLAAEQEIADAEICAVGDDVNDLPMIRAAGLGVAMENAQPEVKAAAGRIAPSNDDDGLVEVVNWLLA